MLSLICLGAGGLSTNPMIETFTLCFRDGRKIRRNVVWVMFHDKGTHIYIKLTGMKYVPNHLIIMKDVYKTWTGVHGPQKHTLVVIAYVLEGLSHKSELLWDRRPPPPHKWEDHKLVLRYRGCSAFLPLILSFQLTISNCKFDWEDTPIRPLIIFSTIHKNKPIYFINEVYPMNTTLQSRYIDEKIQICVFHTLTSSKFSLILTRGDFL